MKTEAVSSFDDICSTLQEKMALIVKVLCATIFTENNAVEVKTAK